MNKAFVAVADGGFSCEYMRELCDVTMDRCNYKTFASNVSSFEETGHVITRGILFTGI
ncbi:hypothetical protein DPMN_150213 [Dreissena polymorpha]|uniref:Uncharacterized protein n=1 Tax=Dreissena polymorpha TaxID=45954 RepID=A0A9D4FCW6_DREPO|nr:hypothetical protein DPMN_150213 [Dreissena polymorpha]